MALSSPGIGSNLDVNSIVNQLLALEKRPLAQLNSREATYQAQLSAYGSLKGAISNFQGSLASLRDPARFDSIRAQSANAAIVAATAASTAAPGNYTVSVNSLAVPQVLQSVGGASPATAGSTGTITVQVGGGAAHVITVDAANNTLEGVRNAINTAQTDVQASIINDGSTTPYRLVLTAASGGTANTINITSSLTTGIVKDAIDNITQAQAPVNANVTINGVSIISAGNELSTAIPGLMLSLAGTGTTKITVSRDTSGIQSAVQSFVKAYNDLTGTVTTLTAYNPATRKAGLLAGSSAAISIQTELRAAAGGNLAGLSGSLATLSQIGVEFDRSGRLTLNLARLNAAAAKQADDIASLFALRGRSSSDLVQFVSSSEASQPGTYTVHITAAATRAGALATTAAAGTTLIDSSNDSLSLNLDGVPSGTLSIPHGSYTPEELATILQSVIGASSQLSATGAKATVGLDGGRLLITSERYGAASAVTGMAGTALTALGFSSATAAAGSDVAGFFILDGNTVDAIGNGQVLRAAAGAPADELAVRHTGASAPGAGTPAATLNLSKGYAVTMERIASRLLADNGRLDSRSEGLARSIQDIATQRTRLNSRLADTETRIRAQFSALDTLISRLSKTSNFLTQQLSRLPGSNNSNT